jgi:hypothetical protein
MENAPQAAYKSYTYIFLFDGLVGNSKFGVLLKINLCIKTTMYLPMLVNI